MRNLTVGVVIGALIAMVNHWSLEDELDDQALYCQMNSEGLWHDDPQRVTEICSDESGGTDHYQSTISATR